jgi:Iodothyronine deiodinase
MMRRWVMALLFVALAADAGFAGARRPKAERSVPEDPFALAGPDVADPAPEIRLLELEGGLVRLSELWADRPLVLVLGSYTCPEFRMSSSSLLRLAQIFSDQVTVGLLYTREALPSDAPSPYPDWKPAPTSTPGVKVELPQAVDMEHRLEAAQLAATKLSLGSPVRIVVDGMEDAAWEAYGPAPHNAFLIDRHGTVMARQAWFDAKGMEVLVRHLLGREGPTQEADRDVSPEGP